MIVWADKLGQVCFKSGTGNVFLRRNSTALKKGNTEWEDLAGEYEEKDLKWAKLHGFWNLAIKLDVNEEIDYKYYGIK